MHTQAYFVRRFIFLGGFRARFACQAAEDFPAGLCVHRVSISLRAAVGRVQLGHTDIMAPVFS